MENLEIEEWSGITFIINCKVQFGIKTSVLFPTHILTNKMDFLPVFIGKPLMNGKISRELFSKGFYGIYVDSRDFCEVDGLKKFIFVHDNILINDDQKRENMMKDIKTIMETNSTDNMANFWLVNEEDFKK